VTRLRGEDRKEARNLVGSLSMFVVMLLLPVVTENSIRLRGAYAFPTNKHTFNCPGKNKQICLHVHLSNLLCVCTSVKKI
jgi:hypothetical protein